MIPETCIHYTRVAYGMLRCQGATLSGKCGYPDKLCPVNRQYQKSNLRIATTRENGQNRHQKKSSQYPGVYYQKSIKRWRAQITIGKEKIYLGVFPDEISAYHKYLEAVANVK
jgi:hypothetical protein